jgi:DNA adenine methylase
MSVATPLTYHGAKERLSEWIISHFPPHAIYCEPFGGSAAVLCRKPPSGVEIYNDLFADVVNFFRVLRDPYDADRLVELLRLTPYAPQEHAVAVAERGVIANSPLHPVERARLFFVRCQMGFGSAGAIQATGFSREGVGGRRTVSVFRNKIESLKDVAERFKGVAIENEDAMDVLRRYDSPTTLFYVDPPYVLNTRKDASTVYAHEYTEEEHRELLILLRGLTGMVVLSGYASTMYDEELPGWSEVSRRDTDQSADIRRESLWLNPAVQQRQLQPSLFKREE